MAMSVTIEAQATGSAGVLTLSGIAEAKHEIRQCTASYDVVRSAAETLIIQLTINGTSVSMTYGLPISTTAAGNHPIVLDFERGMLVGDANTDVVFTLSDAGAGNAFINVIHDQGI